MSTCSHCGTTTTGPFCHACGRPVEDAAHCTRCGAGLEAGALFCNQCGARVSGSRRWTPLAITAVVVVALVPLAYWVGSQRSGPGATTMPVRPAPDSAAIDGGAPGPLTGTPREQADRLFDRIMRARATGDDEQADFFLPMALTAYASAGPLDADGRFHLSLLLVEAERPDDALATAREILQENPDHLLGLGAAAVAARAAGEEQQALTFFRRFLEAVDGELERDLPEYRLHDRAIEEYREAASSAVQGA